MSRDGARVRKGGSAPGGEGAGGQGEYRRGVSAGRAVRDPFDPDDRGLPPWPGSDSRGGRTARGRYREARRVRCDNVSWPADWGGRPTSPRYLFFGGKGGTGKTTCAAAAAIALAERGRQLLVVSTDPAHSLGDVLRRRLSIRPSTIPVRRGRLNACELDADRALDRWLSARRPALATIFERGTILDRDDVEPFLKMSLPGVDELLGLLEIERLAAGHAYDYVVIDTAPTGHTLRLLATPAFFKTFARVLDLMQEKHRALAHAFGRHAGRDDADTLIEELYREGERLAILLRDSARTRL